MNATGNGLDRDLAAATLDGALRSGSLDDLFSVSGVAAWRALAADDPPAFDARLAQLSAGARDVLRQRMREPVQPAGEVASLRFVTVAELLREPPQAWRVLRVIPARGLVVLYGASGSGKTFVGLDLAAAIVQGVAWAGRRTRPGPVAYVAAEGHLRDRFDAYLKEHGLDDLDGLRVLNAGVNLLDPSADIQPLLAAMREFAMQAGGIAVVIIDTLNRVMPGGDENSSEDMGMVIAAAKLIEREFGCGVVFIHHSGKDEAKGSRGHSSLKAATDAEISVRRDGDLRTVTAEKVRDGEDGAVLMTFRLRSVDLGPMTDCDPDADPSERRTSCVVEPVAAAAGAAPVRLSDTDSIALRVLQTMATTTDDRTEATSLHPAGLPRVQVDAWREQFRQVRGVDTANAKAMDASLKAFQRAVDKLTRMRVVGVYGRRVWLW